MRLSPLWITLIFGQINPLFGQINLSAGVCGLVNPCVEGASCKIDPRAPVVGEAFCLCPPGFKGDGKKQGNGCRDVNECGLNPCGIGAECKNTFGSYECICKSGFFLDETGKECVDINECLVEGRCGKDAFCRNTPASYECVCKEATSIFDQATGKCRDPDECKDEGRRHNCDRLNGICLNTVGGFKCSCKKGFQLAEDNTCEDIDECSLGLHNCDATRQSCKNTEGGFECPCNEKLGYTDSSGPTNCENLNECIKYPTICGDLACCLDLPPEQGGYKCAAHISTSPTQTYATPPQTTGVTYPSVPQQTYGHPKTAEWYPTPHGPAPLQQIMSKQPGQGLVARAVNRRQSGTRRAAVTAILGRPNIYSAQPPRSTAQVQASRSSILGPSYDAEGEPTRLGEGIKGGYLTATDVIASSNEVYIPPVNTRHLGPLGHFDVLPSTILHNPAANAQCPAGYINVAALSQSGILKTAEAALRSGASPTSLANGLKSNAGLVATELAGWYKALTNLPKDLSSSSKSAFTGGSKAGNYGGSASQNFKKIVEDNIRGDVTGGATASDLEQVFNMDATGGATASDLQNLDFLPFSGPLGTLVDTPAGRLALVSSAATALTSDGPAENFVLDRVGVSKYQAYDLPITAAIFDGGR